MNDFHNWLIHECIVSSKSYLQCRSEMKKISTRHSSHQQWIQSLDSRHTEHIHSISALSWAWKTNIFHQKILQQSNLHPIDCCRFMVIFSIPWRTNTTHRYIILQQLRWPSTEYLSSVKTSKMISEINSTNKISLREFHWRHSVHLYDVRSSIISLQMN